MSNAPSQNSRIATIADLCDFESGNGFSPDQWSDSGLPIIRIQNLNGSDRFNYFAGEPDPKWIVEPNDLLFAWAGVKGVSFGSTVWLGPRGVLNQHIYRVRPKAGVHKAWLNHAMRWVTEQIERKAHGFKTSLVHVRKGDITEQSLAFPDLCDQIEVADILATWERAIDKTQLLLKTLAARRTGLEQRLFSTGILGKRSAHRRADALFRNLAERAKGHERLLSVTQDSGVVPRDEREGRVTMPSGGVESFKRVRAGHFVISLRSFEGGLEYSAHDGIVSPAYTVLAPSEEVHADYFRHYFKSTDFIRRLSVAVIGIRDGKQIGWHEFSSIKLPLPSLSEQAAVAAVLNRSADELRLVESQFAALHHQKRALMQHLLWGGQRELKRSDP